MEFKSGYHKELMQIIKSGKMRKVEINIQIKTTSKNVIKAFTDPEMLSE